MPTETATKPRKAWRVRLRGDAPESGSIYYAATSGAAGYDYLLDVGDCFPDGLPFRDLVVRRAPECDRLGAVVVDADGDPRSGLSAESLREAAAEVAAVEEWNRLHPIGTPVRVRVATVPGAREFDSVTRSAARLQCGHASVWLEGVAGSWALSHVSPLEVGQ